MISSCIQIYWTIRIFEEHPLFFSFFFKSFCNFTVMLLIYLNQNNNIFVKRRITCVSNSNCCFPSYLKKTKKNKTPLIKPRKEHRWSHPPISSKKNKWNYKVLINLHERALNIYVIYIHIYTYTYKHTILTFLVKCLPSHVVKKKSWGWKWSNLLILWRLILFS